MRSHLNIAYLPTYTSTGRIHARLMQLPKEKKPKMHHMHPIHGIPLRS